MRLSSWNTIDNWPTLLWGASWSSVSRQDVLPDPVGGTSSATAFILISVAGPKVACQIYIYVSALVLARTAEERLGRPQDRDFRDTQGACSPSLPKALVAAGATLAAARWNRRRPSREKDRRCGRARVDGSFDNRGLVAACPVPHERGEVGVALSFDNCVA
jgi:hypothetical protein